MSGLGYISEESPQMCQSCGIIDECRPYGKNHEYICFTCGMKDPETTSKRMAQYILGSIKGKIQGIQDEGDHDE